MGGLALNQERTNILQQLFPHHYTAFVLAGIKAKPNTSFEKLSKPFASNTWIGVGLFVLSAAALIIGLKVCRPKWQYLIFEPESDALFLNTIALVLGLVVHRPSQYVSGRLILGVWLLAAMVLRNSYQGVLFNILQQQSIHELPETIDDLIADNYSILLLSSSSIQLFNNSMKKIQRM